MDCKSETDWNSAQCIHLGYVGLTPFPEKPKRLALTQPSITVYQKGYRHHERRAAKEITPTYILLVLFFELVQGESIAGKKSKPAKFDGE